MSSTHEIHKSNPFQRFILDDELQALLLLFEEQDAKMKSALSPHSGTKGIGVSVLADKKIEDPHGLEEHVEEDGER